MLNQVINAQLNQNNKCECLTFDPQTSLHFTTEGTSISDNKTTFNDYRDRSGFSICKFDSLDFQCKSLYLKKLIKELISQGSLKDLDANSKILPYNNSKSEPPSQQSLDSMVFLDWVNEFSEWTPSEKWYFTYDLAGSLMSMAFFEDYENEWLGVKYEFVYDGNGNVTELSAHEWEEFTGT